MRGVESASRGQPDRSRVSNLLDNVGPSVVSLNGAIASLGVTEFMLAVTGIRAPNRLLTYNGRTGKVTVSTDEPAPGGYCCKGSARQA